VNVLPKRRGQGVSGKEIGGYTYVHKLYAVDIWTDYFDPAVNKVAKQKGFTYNIVKFGKDGQIFSLINSPDFDTADEPIIKDVLLVRTGKTIHYKAPYWIYHHKWMMVQDNYKGFDVEASKQRSALWIPKCKDFSRIGRQDVWKKFLQRHGIE
jgi:hypothetical protein